MNDLMHPIEVKCGTRDDGKPRFVKCWSLRKAMRIARREKDGYAPLSNPTSSKRTPRGLPIAVLKRYENMLNWLVRRAQAVQSMDAGKKLPWRLFKPRAA